MIAFIKDDVVLFAKGGEWTFKGKEIVAENADTWIGELEELSEVKEPLLVFEVVDLEVWGWCTEKEEYSILTALSPRPIYAANGAVFPGLYKTLASLP